jgi:hypothetical protein
MSDTITTAATAVAAHSITDITACNCYLLLLLLLLLYQEDRPYDFDCNEGCLGLGAAIDELKVIASPATAEPTVASIDPTVQPTTAIANPIGGLFPMPVGTLAPTAPPTNNGFV